MFGFLKTSVKKDKGRVQPVETPATKTSSESVDTDNEEEKDSELKDNANASVANKSSSVMETAISSDLAKKLISSALEELKGISGPVTPLIGCIQLIYNVSKAVYNLVKIKEIGKELKIHLLCVSEFYRQFQRYSYIQSKYKERGDQTFDIEFPQALEDKVQNLCGELIGFLVQYLPVNYFEENVEKEPTLPTSSSSNSMTRKIRKGFVTIFKKMKKTGKTAKNFVHNAYVAMSYEDTTTLINERMLLLLQCFVAISSSINNQFVQLRRDDAAFFGQTEYEASRSIEDSTKIPKLNVEEIITSAQTTVVSDQVRIKRQNGARFNLSDEDLEELDKIDAEETANFKLTRPNRDKDSDDDDSDDDDSDDDAAAIRIKPKRFGQYALQSGEDSDDDDIAPQGGRSRKRRHNRLRKKTRNYKSYRISNSKQKLKF